MELESGHVFVCPHPPLKMRTPFGLDCFVLLSRAYHRKTKKERRWQATKSSILSPENNFEHVYLHHWKENGVFQAFLSHTGNLGASLRITISHMLNPMFIFFFLYSRNSMLFCSNLCLLSSLLRGQGSC